VLAKGGVVKALNVKGLGNASLSLMDDWTGGGQGEWAGRAALHPGFAGRRVEVADCEVFHGRGEAGATQKLKHPGGRPDPVRRRQAGVVNTALAPAADRRPGGGPDPEGRFRFSRG